MSELRVEALTHTYSAGTPFEKTAIENISLTIPSGQFVGLLGHTGSGKSTFIQHLNALLKPTGGTVYVDGEDINKDKKSRRAVKNKVGLVFQYPEYQLFEETVFADIAFGPRNMGLEKAEIEQRVREAAHFVGVEEELMERILILDEPTAGLDPAGCRQIMDNICTYRRESGATVIIVSHNMDDAARLTERLIVFDHGHIAMDGSPEEIFSKPEKLVEIGLAVPQATRLAMALREKGVALEGAVFTHGQLMAALKGVGVC